MKVPAIQVRQYGGPEQMQLADVEVGDPGLGEIRIRHAACGLNFIDVYQRTGMYANPLPLTLGMEGAGTVEAVGEGVTHLAPGDRAAYASQPPGAYSAARVMPAQCVAKLPEPITLEEGAAMMLKGMTVHYLLKKTQPAGGLKRGDFILWHAAAGGVGLLACQWARAMGLQLIATAGSEAKCQLALEHGAAHAIDYKREDFVARVKAITGGEGVKAVYDSVGKDTVEKSLDCLAPLGLLACYGSASGKPPAVDWGTLAAKGSLWITRPTLFSHLATRDSMQAMADDLFSMVKSGQVRINITGRYALADAAQAHRDLEARATTGQIVLLP